MERQEGNEDEGTEKKKEAATLEVRAENERIARLEATVEELRADVTALREELTAFRQQFE